MALIEETRLKPRRGKQADRPNVSLFWVIATDDSRTPDEMRELGHLRWTIENQGFRSLNAHLGSKETWTRGENRNKLFPVLLFLMFLAFHMVGAFASDINQEDLRKDLDQDEEAAVRATTLKLVAERIIETLDSATPLVESAWARPSDAA